MKSKHSLPIRLCTVTALLGLAVWGTGNANAANVLFNANLDETGITSQINACPVGWVVDANKTISGPFFDGGDSESFCDTDGGGYGFFFKPFQGNAALGDLLSVNLYQDNSATPNTKYTLSGYVACEPNYSGLFKTNSPLPATVFYVAFLDNSGTILASNSFDLVANGMPTNGPGSMAQMTTPQYTAPAHTVTVRAGVAMLNTYGTSGGQSFFADEFDLEAVAPPGSPDITTEPGASTVRPGGSVSFTVAVSNPSGVSYQWQLNNANISDGGEFSGSTNATLNITGASSADVGHYRALVSNAAGSVYTQDAPLALFTMAINPVITVKGKSGDTYRVDYSTAVNPTTWIPLATNKLGSLPWQVIDPSNPTVGSRYYRAVFLY